jgi:hypothetical protein
VTDLNDHDRVDRWLSALADPDADRPIDAATALARVHARVRRAQSARWTGWQWAAGLAAAVVAIVVAGRETRMAPMAPVPPIPVEMKTDDSAGDEYTALDAGSPMQMGLVVRAEVPASSLASFGVTGSGDVQVDLVIGEDGRAHAFRLVR